MSKPFLRYAVVAAALCVAVPSFATTIFTVSTLSDSGAGTLRAAITAANQSASCPCEIQFSVAGDIALASNLPALTASNVTINGLTAPGASANTASFGQANNSTLTVGIKGDGTSVTAGLEITGSNVVVRGLYIHNVTTGSLGSGIVVDGSASNVTIAGNFIGTDASGNTASANYNGVVVSDGTVSTVKIGTAAPADFNVISGNSASGIVVQSSANGVSIVGNTIGAKANLSGALANNTGINLAAPSVSVGDSTGGNVLSGNTLFGIDTTYGNHTITRNLIGTNGSGTAAIANGNGIRGTGSLGLSNSTIGGATAADGNVISGNSAQAIHLEQTTANPTYIFNNKIGVASDGVTALANTGNGVELGGASNVSVGDGASHGNIIANCSGNAIGVSGGGTRNVFEGNSIYNCSAMGIDLDGDGVTGNDATDSDTGTNNLQNFPAISNATASGTTVSANLTIDSSGSGASKLRINLYRADGSAAPQGKTFLGTQTFSSSALSSAAITLSTGIGLVTGDKIVATATSLDASGNVLDGTSEFSAAAAVTVTPLDLRVQTIGVSPNPMTLGNGNLTFTVPLYNASPYTATNAVLSMTLPANATFVSVATNYAGGTCTQSGGTATCTWSTLPSGAVYYGTVVVTPTTGGTFTLSATGSADQPEASSGDNTSSASATVNSQIDLRIQSFSGSPSPMTLGTGNITWYVPVYNASSSEATSVSLSMTLPANGTFVSGSTSYGGGTCAQSGGIVTCSWATLPSGAVYYAQVVVTPTAGGTVTLSAAVSGAQTDPNNADNSGSGSATVNSQIDLRIQSFSGSPSPMTLGTGDITWYVPVYNASTSEATNVALSITLPANSTFVSGTTSYGGGTCAVSSGVLTCNWSSLPSGANYYAQVVLTPTAGGTLTLSASVAGAQTDPNTSDNSGSGSATVNAQIDLRVQSISASPDPINFGSGDVTFYVPVYNASSSQATNVTLSITRPANGTFVSASTPYGGGSCTTANPVVCTWSSVPSGANYYAYLVLTPQAPGTLAISASATGAQSDPNSSDNSGSYTATVAATSCTAMPSNVVTWYRAEGNGVDASGPNYATGTNVSYTTGKVGQAFSLNGTNAYLSAPDNGSWRPSAFTAEMWVYLNTLPAAGSYYAFISKPAGSGSNDSFSFGVDSSGQIAGVVGNTTQSSAVLTGAVLTTGAWHHVAQTYDGSVMAFYVDGVLSSTSSPAITLGYDSHALLIGADNENGSNTYYTNGLIDEVAFYTRALSSSEINTIWASGTYGKCYTAPAAPTITAFSPSSGGAGTSVTIDGTNFVGVSAVTFNGTAASAISGVSTTQLIATAPSGVSAGTISVAAGGGTATSASSFATATSYTAVANGNWSSASTWSPSGIPGASDTVTISGKSVVLDLDASVASLTLDGTLTGIKTLTVGSLLWNSGSLSGGGTLILPAGKTASFSTTNSRTIDGWVFSNSGTVTIDSTAPTYLTNSGNFSNAAGGQVNLRADGGFGNLGGGTPQVNNIGTITRDTSANTFAISCAFNNNGIVNVSTGTLGIDNGGTDVGGTYAISSGATLRIGGGTHTLDSASFIGGAGTLLVSGGVTTFAGAFSSLGAMSMTAGNFGITGATPLAVGAFSNSGATLSGSNTLTVNGTTSWNGGDLSGSGTFVIPAGKTASFSTSNARTINGWTVNNSGTVTIDSTSPTYMTNGGVFNNLAGGQLNLRADAGFGNLGGTLPQINNSGAITRDTSSGTFAVSVGFSNSGTVNVSTGTLSLDNNGTDAAATYSIASGAALRFGGGTRSIDSASVIGGAGTLSVSGGSTTFAGTFNSLGAMTMSAGTFSVSGTTPLAVGAFTNSGGTLAGSNTFTVNGTTNWNGGDLSGSGTFVIPAGKTASFSTTNARTINGWTVNNSGTVTIDSTSPTYLTNGGVFNNLAGGQLNLRADAGFGNLGGTLPQINNSGAITRDTSSGTFAISVGFSNSGTVNVSTGTLALDNNGTDAAATYSIASGALLRLSGGTRTIDSSSVIGGAGTLSVSGGSTTFAGTFNSLGAMTMSTGTFSVSGTTPLAVGAFTNSGGTLAGSNTFTVNGTTNWNGGDLSGSGTFVIPAGKTASFSTSNARTINGWTVNNSGTVTIDSSSPTYMTNGGVFNNLSGGQLNLQADAGFGNLGGAASQVNNSGTITRSVSSGTFQVNVPFTNDGTLNIVKGIFSPGSGMTFGSGSVVGITLGGTTAATEYGQLALPVNPTLSGTLNVTTCCSYDPAGGSTFLPITISGSTHSGDFSPKNYPTLSGRAMSSSYTAGGLQLSVTSVACTTVPAGAAAWYRAENSGTDAAGPNNATLSGSAGFTAGKVGQAFSFNGTTDYASAADNATLDPTGGVTVEAWINFSSIPANAAIVAKPVGNSINDSYILWYQGGVLKGTIGNASGSGTWLTYSWAPAVNTWHHVAFTYDAATQAEALYIDGVQVATGTDTTTIGYDSRPLTIGADIENGSPAYFFPGAIDEVAIYSGALTAADIAAIYNADAMGKCFVAPAAPTVTGFTPASGTSGTSVTITGTNFTDVTAVSFNGTAATFTVNSATQITAFVPSSASAGAISVTNGGGTGTSAASFGVVVAAHWTNASGGNWSTASNWSTGVVPGSSTQAYIDAPGIYTVNLDVNATVASLTVGDAGPATQQTLAISNGSTLTLGGASSVTAMGRIQLSNGAIYGGGDLTVSGGFDWSGGSIGGDGSNSGAQKLTFTAGAAGTFSGSTKFIDGRSIDNFGSINWTAGDITMYDGAAVTNENGGTISVTAGGQQLYRHCCNESGVVTNAGTITQSGSGSFTINRTFNNSGTLNVQGGSFYLRAGSSTGQLNSSGSGAIVADGSTAYSFDPGATITGNRIAQSGGTVYINTPISVNGGWDLSGGTIAGTADLTFSSGASFNWTGGNLFGTNGGQRVVIASGASASFAGGVKFMDGRSVDNFGTINWTAADVSMYAGAAFKNEAGGNLNVTAAGQQIYRHCCNESDVVTNAGTLTQSGSGSFTVSRTFNNSGVVNVQSGSFYVRTGTNSGTLQSSGSGSIVFDGATSYTLASGTTISGNKFTQSGGTVYVDAPVSVPAGWDLSGGTIAGAADLTFSSGSTFNWTGGSIFGTSGAQKLVIASGATANFSSGTKFMDGRTIDNAGTIIWAAGDISMYGNAAFINESGANVNITAAGQQLYRHCCAESDVVTNAGTITQSGSGAFTMNRVFNNSGLLNVQGGSFYLRTGTSSGQFTSSGSGAIVVDGGTGYTFSSGATITGNRIAQSGGTVTFNASTSLPGWDLSGGFLAGSADLVFPSGSTFNWTGGNITGTSGGQRIVISAGAVANFSAGTKFMDGRSIDNFGTINWTAGDVSMYNGAAFTNEANALLDLTAAGQQLYRHCCLESGAVTNAGTIAASGAGQFTFNRTLNNSGLLKLGSGTMVVSAYSGSGSPALEFDISSAAPGSITFSNPVALTGSLTATTANGYVPQGAQQFPIISYPSGSTATFSPKNLTFGTSPVRTFSDSYSATAVTLTADGPSIATLSPNHGSSAGGTSVTISGSGFVAGAPLAVTFGGVSATNVTWVSAGSITCTAPAGSPGTVNVVVTNGDGIQTTATAAYTYDATPVISGIRPASGSTAGAGGIVITGSNFSAVTSVDFGGSAATILYSSPTELTVAAPAHAAGTVNVTVTNGTGAATLTSGFTYVDNDDVARDFSVATNPSSRWSYGSEPTRGGTFTLSPNHGRTSGTLDVWDGNGPSAFRNSGASTISPACCNPFLAGTFGMHPDSSGQNSVVRWTAPAAGNYRVHGFFEGRDATTTDVAVLKNNSTTLFSDNVNEFGVPHPFDVTVAVAAGDTIEFTVGYGNGSYVSDSTQLDAVIDPVAGAINADLSVSATASAATVASGGSFTYSSTVTNGGPATATGVVVTIALPSNVTLSGTPASSAGTCSGTTTIVCHVGTLAMNASATQTIPVVASGTGSAVANVTLALNETDPLAGNNFASPSIAITGSSTLTVTTNADSGTGSLRQAVLDANSGFCTAPCTIGFNLAAGQRTIQPATMLPTVTAANLTIDGTTQPGYAGTPLVTIDGSADSTAARGIEIDGGHDTIRGLAVINFQDDAIVIDTAGNSVVAGNYIGIQTDGATPGQNAGDGVVVRTDHNTIGGTTAADRNVISGNYGSGVVLEDAGAFSNTVSGNYIGLNAAGTAAVANETDGVQIVGASSNTIGGSTAAARNVISGNFNAAIYLTGATGNTTANAISGNYLGTDAAGTSAVGNANGLYFDQNTSNNVVGGTAAGTGNIIAGNHATGVTFDGGTNVTGNVVAGNYIGTNASNANLGQTIGVFLANGAAGNTIGGTSAGNVIAFNIGSIVTSAAGAGNAFIGNQLRDTTVAIDLDDDGPTANDPGDSDSGSSNNLQNTPVFVDATLAGGTLTAHVSVDSGSVPATGGIRVELFKSDATGVQAQQLLASQCIAGNVLAGTPITVTNAPVAIGDKLVATATSYAQSSCGSASDGTSEVSAAVAVSACTPPAATITASGPTTFCNGGSVTLTASAGASYQWRNFGTPIVSANAQTYVATTSGSYTVTVSDATGCSATSAATSVTASSTVAVAIAAGGPTTFCAPGGVTLTANASGGSGTYTTYQWLLGGNPINTASGPTYNATATGSYSVTVTDSNGCTATSAPVSVTANAAPPATINAPASACANSTVAASIASPVSGATYTWTVTGGTLQSGQGTSSITIAASTSSISLSVVASNNGCTANGSANISVGSFTPAITASGPTSFCSGGSVTLTASAGTSYQWLLGGNPIGGANAQTYVATAAGSYSVTVTGGGGCSGTSAATSVTVNPAPAAAINAPSSVSAGSAGNAASVTAPAGSTFVWSISNGTITGGNNTPSITFTAGASGSVDISVTISNGSCTGSGSISIPIAVPSQSANLAVSAFASPNPVNAGGTVTFTINVTNNGPDTAQDVRVTSSLSGVSSAVASGSGWTCLTSGSSITCSVPSLAAGAAPAITVSATAGASGAATDDVFAVTTTNDPNVGNNSATASAVINGAASCNNSAPALIAPANGAVNVGNPVAFSWNATPNATSYDLWIGSGNAAASIAATTASTGASVSLPAGPSTWYVVAHFGSNCPTLASAPRTLTVAASTNCPKTAPQLVAPAAGSNVSSPVAFSWTAVSGAAGYRLWVAIDGGAAQDVGTTNAATTSLSVPLSGASVTWRVDALYPGCDAAPSATSSFTMSKPDPCASHAAPSLTSPASNATVASSLVDFGWTAVSGASGYRLWIRRGGESDFALAGSTAATTLHTNVGSGHVDWYVEALFEGCAATQSAQSAFTVPAGANCGANAAAAPGAPANDSSVNDAAVDFTWQAAPNAIGYELWLALNDGTPSLAGTTTTATTLHRTVGAGTIEWFTRALFNGCDPVESAHARFTFTPPPACGNVRPILTAPAGGSVITPVDFRWSSVAGATQYKVWMLGTDGGPQLVGSTAETHLDGKQFPAGPVTWYVEALFSGCPSQQSAAGSFVAVPPPPACSTPATPLTRADSTASTNVEYTIRWSATGPAAETQYELQEADNVFFNNPSTQTLGGTQAPFRHVNDGSAPLVFYYRVRAVSTCNGSRSLFSGALAVAVLPSQVSDVTNANGATPADNPQPTQYQIHIGGTGTAGAPRGIIAAAAGDLFVATTNQPWLTVSPSTGTVGANGTTLTVTAQPNGLPVGTNTGAVYISFGTTAAYGRVVPRDDKPATTTTVSVNLTQPVSPTAKSAPPPDALIIPAVAHADGVNSKFQSDVRVTNTSAQPVKYQVTFTPTGDSGISQGKQTTIDVDAGRTVALDDVLDSWFGSGGATGTLEVRPLTTAASSSSSSSSSSAANNLANLLTFASSRTYNTTLNGTFGQYIPAIPFASFVGRGSDPAKSTVLSLQQVAQSDAYRTNIGLVEGSGEAATVLVTAYGDDGQKLTEFTQDLKGGQHVQLNSILAQKNVEVSDGRVEVKVVAGSGKVTTYASVIDNKTNDPLLVSPVAVNQTAAARYVIPGVADLNNGFANWQTDVRIFNPTTKAVNTTLTFFPQGGGEAQSKSVTLAPGEVKTIDTALSTLFGISNAGGALHITASTPAPLVATARTYNQTSTGTYGQFIPAVTANDAAALGTRPLQLLQIEESNRYRSNIGFAEVSGKPAKIEVTAIPPDSKFAISTQIDLTANQFIQYPQMLKSMGLANMYNVRVTVKVISGQGRVAAYASVIDAQTNDPTYVPAQ